ncbi:MAG: phosphodiester glycosidase family protein [Planctomycetaceae bacterium]
MLHLFTLCCLLLVTPAPQYTPPDWNTARQLAPGILLMQDSLLSPRPIRRHAVRIDLHQPGLKLTTTSRISEWQPDTRETRRQTVRSFLRSERADSRPVVLAFNADAFTPWPAPFDKETPANLQGFAVCRRQLVSPPSGSPSLIITSDGKASIRTATGKDDPSQIDFAVSGFALCLKDGQVQPSGDDLHPRTAIGLSADHRLLFVLVVDGRRHSSAGATTAELGQWLLEYGASDAINMDGGGSSTLAWWNNDATTDDKIELLNRPVGNGLKLLTPQADQLSVSERANGNNVGIWLQAP